MNDVESQNLLPILQIYKPKGLIMTIYHIQDQHMNFTTLLLFHNLADHPDSAHLETSPMGQDPTAALSVRHFEVLADPNGQAKQFPHHQAVNEDWHGEMLQSRR